ncbi:hypothetical protein RJ641_000424, partial [Dillenia turbinata]
TNLTKLRSEYKDAFVKKYGVKLGSMSGFVKVPNLLVDLRLEMEDLEKGMLGKDFLCSEDDGFH